MPRPGCVWTHTILIDVSFLWMIKDLKGLTTFFKRPGKGLNYDYSIPIVFDLVNSINLADKNTEEFYKISDVLYSTAKPVIFLSSSSKSLENTVLDIWSFQWPRLKRNFTFCTGAISVRRFGNNIFSLQIMPYSRERSLSKFERENILVVDSESSAITSSWILSYKSVSNNVLSEFMTKFGADVNPEKSRFLSLFTLFSATISGKQETPILLISLAAKFFPDPNEAKHIKSILIESVITQKKFKYFIIKTLLNKPAFDKINLDCSQLIVQAFNSNDLRRKDLPGLLLALFNKNGEDILIETLLKLPIESWISYVPIYNSIINLLITPTLFSSAEIWNNSDEIQNFWLAAGTKSKKNSLQLIINVLLDNCNESHLEKIFQLYGNAIYTHIFYWIFFAW